MDLFSGEKTSACRNFTLVVKRTMDLYVLLLSVFSALINLAVPDTIDVRALNRKAKLNVYTKTENLNLALNAAKSIGCQVVNIGAQDLIEGRPILILGLMWQIIRMQLLSQISIKNYPELVLLLDDGEDLAALLKLTPEDILMRWFNYHLKKAGSDRRVKTWTKDLIDSECYSVLLNQLNPAQCALVTGTDHLERAKQVCANTRHLGVQSFLNPADIVTGNRNLNVGFVAQLFNTCPGAWNFEEFFLHLYCGCASISNFYFCFIQDLLSLRRLWTTLTSHLSWWMMLVSLNAVM